MNGIGVGKLGEYCRCDLIACVLHWYVRNEVGGG